MALTETMQPQSLAHENFEQAIPPLDASGIVSTVVKVEEVPVVDQINQFDPHPLAEHAEPYHIHFFKGSEGHDLNPDAAEHNLDSTLMLSWAIKNQFSLTRIEYSANTPRKVKSQIDVEHARESMPREVKWFFEKYPSDTLTPSSFYDPNQLVRTWLERLGPQNDMADASADLIAARNWLVAPDSIHAGLHKPDFKLVADVDLELAHIELLSPTAKRQYLLEAAAYTQKSYEENLQENRSDSFGAAVIDRMTLTHIRTEIKKLDHFNSTDLSEPHLSEEANAKFKSAYEQDIEILGEDISVLIAKTLERLESLDGSEIKEVDKLKKSIGLLYEAVTYYSFSRELIDEDKFLDFSIAPATIRQESGTAHKIVEPNKVYTADEKRALKDRETNTNFDLVFNEYLKGPHKYRVESVYLQNKVDPDYAPELSANGISKLFFGSKEFRYITPQSMLGLWENTPEKFEANKNTIMQFATSMSTFMNKRNNVRAS